MTHEFLTGVLAGLVAWVAFSIGTAALWVLWCSSGDIISACRRRWRWWRAERTGLDARSVDLSVERRARLDTLVRAGASRADVPPVPPSVARVVRHPATRKGGAA